MTRAEKKQIDEQGLKWNNTLRTVLKELQILQKETKQTHITDVMPNLTVIYTPNSEVCRWLEKAPFDECGDKPDFLGRIASPFKGVEG